ncbi:MAG: glycosyltransferase [Acidobacteriota bacterium]
MSRSLATRRRALIVAYDFPPHAAIGTMRTLRVVRRLHASGWEVSVLTSDPSTYLAGTPVDLMLLDAVPPDVRVIRAAALRPWERSQRVLRALWQRAAPQDLREDSGPLSNRRGRKTMGLARMKDVVDAVLSIPDRESGWLLPALVKGVATARHTIRPDVIYSSAPPWTGQLVAAGLRLALRRPWVADFRDPWSRAPWRGDRFSFSIRTAAMLERFVVNRADRLVFVAAANRDEFAAEYTAAVASKFVVVPNGCDPAEFDRLRPRPVPARDPFVMLHAGSLYAGRTPVPLLNALAAAIAQGRIDPARFRLRFLGPHALEGVDLPATCRRLGLHEVVEFLPRVPREQSLRAMMMASCLLLLQPGHSVSVPGKLYEYLAAGRPVLAVAEEGETADLVRRSGGVSVSPAGEAAIAEAIVTAIRAAPSRTSPLPSELFDGNVGAAQIERILETVVGAQGAPAGLEDIGAES